MLVRRNRSRGQSINPREMAMWFSHDLEIQKDINKSSSNLKVVQQLSQLFTYDGLLSKNELICRSAFRIWLHYSLLQKKEFPRESTIWVKNVFFQFDVDRLKREFCLMYSSYLPTKCNSILESVIITWMLLEFLLSMLIAVLMFQ